MSSGIVEERRDFECSAHRADYRLAVVFGQAAQYVGGDVGGSLVEDGGQNGGVEGRRQIDGVLGFEVLERLRDPFRGQTAGDKRLGLAV